MSTPLTSVLQRFKSVNHSLSTVSIPKYDITRRTTTSKVEYEKTMSRVTDVISQTTY